MSSSDTEPETTLGMLYQERITKSSFEVYNLKNYNPNVRETEDIRQILIKDCLETLQRNYQQVRKSMEQNFVQRIQSAFDNSAQQDSIQTIILLHSEFEFLKEIPMLRINPSEYSSLSQMANFILSKEEDILFLVNCQFPYVNDLIEFLYCCKDTKCFKLILTSFSEISFAMKRRLSIQLIDKEDDIQFSVKEIIRCLFLANQEQFFSLSFNSVGMILDWTETYRNSPNYVVSHLIELMIVQHFHSIPEAMVKFYHINFYSCDCCGIDYNDMKSLCSFYSDYNEFGLYKKLNLIWSKLLIFKKFRVPLFLDLFEHTFGIDLYDCCTFLMSNQRVSAIEELKLRMKTIDPSYQDRVKSVIINHDLTNTDYFDDVDRICWQYVKDTVSTTWGTSDDPEEIRAELLEIVEYILGLFKNYKSFFIDQSKEETKMSYLSLIFLDNYNILWNYLNPCFESFITEGLTQQQIAKNLFINKYFKETREKDDFCILFELWNECGKYVNVADMFEAFKTIISENDTSIADTVEESPMLRKSKLRNEITNLCDTEKTPPKEKESTPEVRRSTRKRKIQADKSQKVSSKKKQEDKENEDVRNVIPKTPKASLSFQRQLLTKSSSKKESDDKILLSRFTLALSELCHMGLLKKTGRRQDHLIKVLFV